MPAYSLNWTARSSAIHGAKGVNDAAHPPEGYSAETGGLTASSLPLFPFRSLALEASSRQDFNAYFGINFH